MRPPAFLALCLAGWLVSGPAAAQVGTVLGEQKIASMVGGLNSGLSLGDTFGGDVAGLGDLDGDGIGDLVVTAPGDDTGGFGRGAIWVLFLNADGTVKAQQKIAQGIGGLTTTLDNYDRFGHDLAVLGDLDGDGVCDLAVGARGDDDGALDMGAVWILFLNTDGTVKAEQKISQTMGGFSGVLDPIDWFGSCVAALGDVNGDGITDLAVGAILEDDVARDTGALWILLMNADGTVQGQQKISATDGGLTGPLEFVDNFGESAAGPGDLNGDGISDVIVGAPGDSDGGNERGALYVLYLNADGTVASEKKISSTQGGFTGALANDDNFGFSVAVAGDLDGDGVGDLVVGAPRDADGGGDRGAVWILFMNADETVKAHQKISQTAGGFTGPLAAADRFGCGVGVLGDVNGDGATDLVVGAEFDDTGGSATGAAYVLFLECNSASAVARNGAGVNPATLHSLSLPILGSSWDVELDCRAHAPGAALLYAYSQPGSGPLIAFGEILVAGTRILALRRPHLGGPALFQLATPADPALCGLTSSAQGVCLGAPGPVLSNALDLVLGQ